MISTRLWRVLLILLGILLGALLACAPRAAAQNDPVLAQQRFEEGFAHYRARRWGDALRAFRASYELAPSPNSRLFVGRSLRELGELGQAYGELVLAATEAEQRASTDPRYGPTADAARTEAGELEPRIGRVTVAIDDPPPGLRVTVDEREVPRAGLGLAVPVDPGEIAIVAEARGYARFETTRRVGAGEEISVSVTLERDAGARAGAREGEAREPIVDVATGDGASALTVSGLVLGGVAVAAAASFAVFYLLADRRFDDLATDCLPAACPPERHDEIDEGRTFQTIANVSLGVAIGAAAIGAALIVAGSVSGPAEPATRAHAPGLLLRW